VELSSFWYKNQHTWSLGLKTLLTTHKDTKDVTWFSTARLIRWTGEDDTQPLQRCGIKNLFFWIEGTAQNMLLNKKDESCFGKYIKYINTGQPRYFEKIGTLQCIGVEGQW